MTRPLSRMPTHSLPLTQVLRCRILAYAFTTPSMVHLPTCYDWTLSSANSLYAHLSTLSPFLRFNNGIKFVVTIPLQKDDCQHFLLKIIKKLRGKEIFCRVRWKFLQYFSGFFT